MDFREKQIAMAKKTMKNFVATIVQNNDDFFIVDWAAPDTNAYSTRYILDIQRGVLTIAGDTGYCVADWCNKVTPQDLRSYLHDEDYFMQKIRTSTDLHTYYWEDIKTDLQQMEAEFARVWENYEPRLAEMLNVHFDIMATSLELVQDAFAPIYDYLSSTDVTDDTEYPEEIHSILATFDPHWEENGLNHIGQRVSGRIYLWTIGYEMLSEQL